MTVSASLARTALEQDVATPLGLDLHEAASAVLGLAVERMVTAIEGITLSQGIDPSQAVMIGGGGGAGLYSVGIARRLGVREVILPDVAAALSASGALVSDLQTIFATTNVMSTNAFDHDRAAQVLAELNQKAEGFLARSGADARSRHIRFSVEARYPHQVWEIEVPLRHGAVSTPDLIAEFCEDFHRAHDDLFAVRDKDSPVEVVTWRAHALCSLRQTGLSSARPEQSARDMGTHRTAYFPATGRVDTAVVAHDDLPIGETRTGPLIVESPVTTVVLDERAAVERLSSGSLRIMPLAELGGDK
jgi:N-methylhydantoinase A